MDKGAEAPLYWFINGESVPTTGGVNPHDQNNKP